MDMYKLVIVSLILVFFSACKQVDNTNDKQKAETVKPDSKSEFTGKLREVYHRFPSPDEMLALFNVENIAYNSTILNSPENSKQYIDSKSQALNIGIYIADLAYLTLYEQHNESVKYFEVLYELSDKLRISSAFDRSLLKRIQENLTNSDSLKVIAEDVFLTLSNYLESNSNEKVFALISIGGFIEAQYLSFKIADEYDTENPLIKQIADQKFVLENIIKYANDYSSDKNVESALEELKGITEVYNNLKTETKETVVTRDESGKLKIEGGTSLLISEEEYLQLKEATMNARKNITQK